MASSAPSSSCLPTMPAFITQAFPPKATWGPEDMPDLTGGVVVVTGGYAGIGMHTAKVSLEFAGIYTRAY
jgi:hypothetical protein